MQTSQFSFKKSIWPLLLLTITVFSISSISSCSDKKEKEEDQKNLGATCMTLSKTQINKYWVTEFTKPGLPPAQQIAVLKFYSSYIRGGGFDVRVQAFNQFDAPLGVEFDLNPGVSCGLTLPPCFIGRSNDIEWSSLNILKADGTLVDNFSKIILTPDTLSMGGYYYLKYNVAVVVGDVSLSKGSGLPCPPCINCRPPCPVGCEPPCTKEDSTAGGLHPVNARVKDTANNIK